MKVKIKRLDKNLPLPTYATAESAAFDFICRETTIIGAKNYKVVPANNIIEAPHGYFLAVLPRSSTIKKKGLIMPNSIGVIDPDYSGPEDEVLMLFYNLTDQDVTVEKGERIAQGIFIKIDQVEWDEVNEVRPASRGGFGSTG